MIITHSFMVGGKGYREGVKADGSQWQSQSFRAYPFEQYISVFLPDYVKVGMVVTVSGTVKKTEDGEYTNYTLNFPTVDTVYIPQQEPPAAGSWTPGGGAVSDSSPQADVFSRSKPLDIQDDDLPF